MTAFTKADVRELAKFTCDGGNVVSVYLDVDGRRTPKFADVEARLERMVRAAIERAAGNGHSDAVGDIRRIEAHIKKGVQRAHIRGLAVFSCERSGLWEVYELPVPVRDQLVINATPHVTQLERVLERGDRFGVLLADRQRARMFVYEYDELIDRSELFEALPRGEDEAGHRDRNHERDHVEEAAHAHLRHAAQVAFDAYQRDGFDHLVIGAPNDIANELENNLHRYLQERVVARCPLPVAADETAIREAVVAIETDVERRREAKAVARLRDAVGQGRGGVAGLEGVLNALSEKRVATLLVSDGYEAPGWRCRECGFLGLKANVSHQCPTCGEELSLVDDVVGEALDEALTQGCDVEVCEENADLDVLGRVGALLRY